MAAWRETLARASMNRLARSEEIAATFAFLASDDASYISGQNIIVDGALTARIYDAPRV